MSSSKDNLVSTKESVDKERDKPKLNRKQVCNSYVNRKVKYGFLTAKF